MIEKNKNPAGRQSVIIFGLFEIFDGLVRLFTLGHYHTNLLVSYSRKQAKIAIENLKKNSK